MNREIEGATSVVFKLLKKSEQSKDTKIQNPVFLIEKSNRII
jgi:hypothetical protein